MNSIQATPIQLDTRDRGIRIALQGCIGTARYKIQVDIGSGGTIIPAPTWIDYPALLEFDAPKLLGYPKESIVAVDSPLRKRRGFLRRSVKTN